MNTTMAKLTDLTADGNYTIVWTADQNWWDIRGEEIELADDFDADAMLSLFPEDHEYHYLNECSESFSCEVLSVGEHTILRVGDICVSHGYGDDKFFLREV